MVVKILMLLLVTNLAVVAAMASTGAGQSADASKATYDPTGSHRSVFVFIAATTAGVIVAIYQGLLDLHHIFNTPFGPGLLQVQLFFFF